MQPQQRSTVCTSITALVLGISVHFLTSSFFPGFQASREKAGIIRLPDWKQSTAAHAFTYSSNAKVSAKEEVQGGSPSPVSEHPTIEPKCARVNCSVEADGDSILISHHKLLQTEGKMFAPNRTSARSDRNIHRGTIESGGMTLEPRVMPFESSLFETAHLVFGDANANEKPHGHADGNGNGNGDDSHGKDDESHWGEHADYDDAHDVAHAKLTKEQKHHMTYTSYMVIMFLFGVTGLIHAMQAADPYIALQAHELVNVILAIFISLIIVDLQHLLWMAAFHDYTHLMTEDTADLATLVFFIPWFLAISVGGFKCRRNPIVTQIWVEGVAKHVAAFTVIEALHHSSQHLAAEVSHKYPGSAGAMLLFKVGCVLFVWSVFLVLSFVAQYLRRTLQLRIPEEDHEHWIEICQECEADASAIASGHFYMNLIWTILWPGVVTPAECVAEVCDPRPFDLTKLVCVVVVLGVFSVLFSRWLRNTTTVVKASWLAYGENHLAMFIGWTGYLALSFRLASMHEDFRRIYKSPISRRFLGAMGFVSIWMGMVILITFAHRRRIIHQDNFVELNKALSLVCAVCLESVYGEAIPAISETAQKQIFKRLVGRTRLVSGKGADSLGAILIKTGLSLGMTCFVVPAWQWYVAPKVVLAHEAHKAHEEQFALEDDSNVQVAADTGSI